MARLEGFWQLVNGYGFTWDLAAPTGGITRMTGMGLPPATVASQHAPTQHGTARLGFALDDREIIVGLLWRGASGGHDCAAERRRRQPYRALGYLSGPLTLRCTFRDHAVRELRQVEYGGGLERDSDLLSDDAEEAAVRLVCRDPAWYDPAGHTVTVDYASMTHALYGDFRSMDAADGVETGGDWYAYPTVAIHGPCTDFDLQSTTTGQRLRYYGDVAAGEVVTICCNPHPAYLSAVSTVEGDVERWIYPEDDFGGFCLWPDPLAAGGENEWELDTVGMTAASYIVITWEDRWQGL